MANVAAQYQSNYVSAYDVHKPDVLSKMFNRYGDQGSSWFLTLEKLGFVKPVGATSYSHYENELKNPTFNSLGIATASGTPLNGQTIAITLSPSNLDSFNNFYPRLNDIVYFKGGQLGMITAINVTVPTAPVLTITQVNAWPVAPAALLSVAAGEELSLVSNAFSEGSDQPKGIMPGAAKRTNYTQIMKETLAVTGTELTNQTWFDGWIEVPGSVNGSEQIASGNSWYNLNWMDMEWRIGKQISGALLFGETTVGTITDPVTGLPIRTTNGLIPTIKSLGNTDTYVPGAFSVTDFDAYGRILDREYAGEYVMSLVSKSFSDEIENTMVAYLANTNIIYEIEQQLGSRFGVDGKSISVDFSYLKKSNRTFMFKRMMEFSNRQTFGINGSITDGMGVFLPMNKVKDAKSGQMLDNIGARYKNLNGYSRKMEVWSVNGAGPGMKVSSVDVNKSFIRTDMGAHIMGANQMILVTT
jgi:hypothetical protein